MCFEPFIFMRKHSWSHNFLRTANPTSCAHNVDLQRLPDTIGSTITWEQQKPTSCEHRGRRGTSGKYRGTPLTCHATRSKLRNHSNKYVISKSSRYHATHCPHENTYPFQIRCFAFGRSLGSVRHSFGKSSAGEFLAQNIFQEMVCLLSGSTRTREARFLFLGMARPISGKPIHRLFFKRVRIRLRVLSFAKLTMDCFPVRKSS